MTGVRPFEIPTWECYDLIGGRTVGRLCVIDHGYPLAFPINYRATGQPVQIVMRSSRHSIIARHTGPVSLEVDDIDEAARTAWSVILRGSLRHVSTAEQLPDPEPWVTEGRHQWIVMEVAAVSGRRFVARPGSDGFSVEWSLDAGPT
jgi:nitroimidazol reductase NimA-like FMN-containing flavoprotein (pyridoxamine 5'-phosphate oxidase superfamily)